MKGKRKEPKPQRSSQEGISVFWKHMIMMLGILLVCLIALVVVHEFSLSILTRENLEKMQLTLERDCEALSTEIYASISIPETIERTKYYEYIRSDNDGVLDYKNYSLLEMIRTSLNGLVYQKSSAAECVLYLKGPNSIAAGNKGVAVAEDYFEKYVSFSESDSAYILECLRQNGGVYLLPMQYVDGTNTVLRNDTYLPVILLPRDKRISIMTLYPQDTILEELGISFMPEGTHAELRTADGQILMQYPEPASDEVKSSSHVLSGSLGALEADVTIWVPDSYFAELMRPVKTASTFTIILVVVAGFAMAILFSRASVEPIRKLIHTHGDDPHRRNSNEITHLDKMLCGAQQKTEQMLDLLIKQILARAMSGAIISERDEEELRKRIPYLSENYRVAILHTAQEVNEMLDEHLHQLEGAVWTPISNEEAGLIIRDSEESLEQLSSLVDTLIQETKTGSALCGISAPATDLSSLHKAVRQARAAVPQENGMKLFPGEQISTHAISWLQHERLYQSIFSNAEEDAMTLLRSIAKNTNHNNAREVFYNVRFVIHSAAEEMDIPFPEKQELDFRPDRSPQDNIKGLESMLHLLFSRMREKNEDRIVDEQMAILDYIHKNLGDYELCTATVAARFGMVEQRVYKIVRMQTGLSFGEYVHQQRMKQAAALLYSTKLSNAEVAQQCGYRIASTFYRQFKEHYGISPGQYRRDNGQAEDEKK